MYLIVDFIVPKMFSKLTLYIAIIYWCVPKVYALRSLVVETTSGLVMGRVNQYKSMEYLSYHGIPYAENPTGPLRFMPPVPRKPWNNVLDATREGPVCAQLDGRYQIHQMSEDCLNVNVYVPMAQGERLLPLLPVTVVVHGGGLQCLSGNSDYLYGPQLILERKIIVVTMNYRLGPLGFLSLDIEEASGNAALKDVLLSLKWVQQNIRKFGGNPRNVTVYGHSSGSVILHNLMLTNKSEGLFNQVILLGGSALSPKAFMKHPKSISLGLARELGITTSNEYNILKRLQEVDPYTLLEGYKKFLQPDNGTIRKLRLFLPSKEIGSSHAIIIEDPAQYYRKNGNLAVNVTILAGISAQEGIILAHNIEPSAVSILQKHPENCIPINIEYPFNSQRAKKLGESVGELYFGKNKELNPMTAVEEIISDTVYVYGLHHFIKRYTSVSGSYPLYFYILDFQGDLNWCKVNYNISFPGTAHSDEMGYIFVTKATKTKIETADTRSLQMLNTLMDFISNFIYYGNPTPHGSIKWLDYGKEQRYLSISDELAVKTFGSHELNSRMQFWANTYSEYFEYIENGGITEYPDYNLD